MDPRDPAEGELQRLEALMDAEVRAEQAEYEALALQAEWRARSLGQVVGEWMARGDRVELRLPELVVQGTVIHAGNDFAVLRTATGTVEVPLRACSSLRVLVTSRTGGTPPGRGARTWRARLTEHETTAAPLRIRCRDGEEHRGVILAVAVDHLLVRTGHGQLVLPDQAVVAVWPDPYRT